MTTVRIWFTKTGEASYISLLDLQRVMGRSLKRSRLPVWYTLGFNPHIYMTFASPLSLGQESLVESVDVKTEEEHLDFDAWRTALNKVMPTGIEVTKVEHSGMKASEIAFARYTVRLSNTASAVALDAYNELPQALVEKKSKRGMRSVDLKETLPKVDYRVEGDEVVFDLLLPAGETLNLNPTLFTGFMQEHCGLESHPHILRTGLLTKNMQDFQ